ncbi:E3 ubiquitin-protein ligase MARCH5 isoform X1 [Drosophila miranda]|uniref:E3 ubiquitin-protein ligase MARCH5 isoform X1 n=2 Tax=Drosophila miranda TaxID=7229 RepID=UPI0007E7D9EA|nr:E3 ubiquitin-protein ligase MARCH5 isoform X1 [Drosophila miranda]
MGGSVSNLQALALSCGVMEDFPAEMMSAGDGQGDATSQESSPSSGDNSGQLSLHHSEGPENQDEDRTCWICFASEGENRRALWVQPCQCRGTTKWVHQSCLYRWLDEKQKGNIRRIVVCQQCLTEYLIIFPPMARLASVLDFTERLVRRTSPYLVATIFFGSIYWSAMTFGAITVVQVMGNQRGFVLIENANTLALATGLPLIPMGLVVSRLIRWEDATLNFIRRRHNIFRKLPLLSWCYGSIPESEDELAVAENSSAVPFTMEPLYIARVCAGALVLPTFATIVGGIFFRGVHDSLYRNLLGGATYIAVKGLLNIYLRQKLYLRRRRRIIYDYTEENLRLYGGNQPDGTTAAQPGAGLLRQDAGFEYDFSTDSYETDDSDVYDSSDLSIHSDPGFNVEYSREDFPGSWSASWTLLH